MGRVTARFGRVGRGGVDDVDDGSCEEGRGGEVVGGAETVLDGISEIGRGKTGEGVGSGVMR